MPGSSWAIGAVSFDAGGDRPRARSNTTNSCSIRRRPESRAASAVPAALPAPPPYKLPTAALRAQRPMGAAARAPVRHVGGARFRNAGAAPAATHHGARLAHRAGRGR